MNKRPPQKNDNRRSKFANSALPGFGSTHVPKHVNYLQRVDCIEYDLQHMIKAYGLQNVITLARQIAAGKVDCRQTVQRWAAHKHLEFLASIDEMLGQ